MAVDLDDWRVQRYLDWLCTIKDDREPRTQAELCKELGWGEGRPKQLREDPDFGAAWEHRYRQTVGSPEKAQLVIERLYETATDRTDPRQVPAARAYLDAIDAVKPKKVDVTVTGKASELTQEQLDSLLAAGAQSELERRGS